MKKIDLVKEKLNNTTLEGWLTYPVEKLNEALLMCHMGELHLIVSNLSELITKALKIKQGKTKKRIKK